MTNPTNESARQVFQRADTAEGFIAVVHHRPRDWPALAAQGWRDSVDEALSVEKASGEAEALDAADQLIASLREENAAAHEQLTRSTAEADTLRSEKASLQELATGAEAEIETLGLKLLEAEAANEDLSKKLAAATATLASAQQAGSANIDHGKKGK